MKAKYYRNAYARRGPAGEPVRIYVLTDSHLRADVDGDPEHAAAGTAEGRSYYAVASKIRHFVDRVIEDEPHHVLHLGDIVDAIDGSSDFPGFNATWADIPAAIETDLMIGNHDFDDLNYAQIVEALGYDEGPIVAGSHFNKTFVVEHGDAAVRIIMLDTNYNASDNHAYTVVGRLPTASIEWVESVLLASEERLCLVCSHHLPQYWDATPYFDEDDAKALRDVVLSSMSANADLQQVVSLGGHHHGLGLQRYEDLGGSFPGFRLPDVVEGRGDPATSSPHGCNVVSVFPNGFLLINGLPVVYPYP